MYRACNKVWIWEKERQPDKSRFGLQFPARCQISHSLDPVIKPSRDVSIHEEPENQSIPVAGISYWGRNGGGIGASTYLCGALHRPLTLRERERERASKSSGHTHTSTHPPTQCCPVAGEKRERSNKALLLP